MFDNEKQREAIAQYPESVKEDVVYIAQTLAERYDGDTKAMAADLKHVKLDRSESWFYKLVSGKYMQDGVFTAGETTVAAIAKALREIAAGNFVGGIIPHTETDNVKIVRAAIDAARFRGNVCKWVLIVGPTGSQKSHSVMNYAYTHEECFYVEAPDKPNATELIRRLARVAKCPKNENKKEWLEDSIRENSVVIIDNAQRIYDARRGLAQPVFSYLQTLQDSSRCVMVLVFVDEATGEDSLTRIMLGKDRGYFEQLIGRAGGVDRIVRLSTLTSDADLLAFAKSAGFKDAALRREILPVLRGLAKREGKVRIALKALQEAARAAFAQRRDVNLEDFLGVLPVETFNDKQRLYIETLRQKALPCA